MSKWRGVFITTKTGDLLNKVVLRLARSTCRNRPGSKIIACHGPGDRVDHDNKREASVIEEVGYYDDCVNISGKRVCLLDIAKIRKYIVQGAEPTIVVWKLLGASGAFPVHPRVYKIAAENQYTQEIFPQDTTDLSLSEYPSEYPTYIDDRDKSDPDYIKWGPRRGYESNWGTPKQADAYKRLSEEDRDNKYKGSIKQGDYKHLVNHLNSIEEVSPVQRRALEHDYVKSFWALNEHDRSANGLHGNFEKVGVEQEDVKERRKQYGHWTRRVRTLGYTDPFKLAGRPPVHRIGENEQLLEETKPK